MITNITANTYTAASDHLHKLLFHLKSFFSKTNKKKTEATLSHSQCQVFQRLQHHVHLRVNTYSAISFEEINFFTMAHLHFDYGKPL